MATERNPYEGMPTDNVVVMPMETPENPEVSIEIDPDGDGVIVDFETPVMEGSEEVQEWYGNLAEDLDEEELT